MEDGRLLAHFIKKNDKTSCRKWFGIAGPERTDRKAAAAAAMLWCSRARQFERQRLHIAFQPDFASVPDAGLTRLLPISKRHDLGIAPPMKI